MDLAKIYEVETKRLKESVRRNIHRFPEDFMFELTREEWFNLRSQFASSSWGGSRYLPIAFTEQGVAIMRAFVMIRQWALTYQELSDKLSDLEKLHNQKFNDIDQVLKYLLQKDHSKTQQAQREQLGYKK